MSDKTFEDATFYTVIEEEEYLRHKSPEDCLDGLFDEEEDWRETLDEYEDPVLVIAYEPQKVTPEWIERVADRVVELIDEEWDEEYGGGDGPMAPKGDARKEAIGAAQAAVAKYATVTKVWRCEEIAEREYSHKQVIEILKRRHPDWDWSDPDEDEDEEETDDGEGDEDDFGED